MMGGRAYFHSGNRAWPVREGGGGLFSSRTKLEVDTDREDGNGM